MGFNEGSVDEDADDDDDDAAAVAAGVDEAMRPSARAMSASTAIALEAAAVVAGTRRIILHSCRWPSTKCGCI